MTTLQRQPSISNTQLQSIKTNLYTKTETKYSSNEKTSLSSHHSSASSLSYIEPITSIKNTILPEYLDLEDGISGQNYYSNYYDELQYEVANSSERKKKILFIIFSALGLLLLTVFISIVTIYLKTLSSKNFQANQYELTDYCSDKTDSTSQLTCRRTFIRNMTIDAFSAYRRYAWGQPELAPVTKKNFYIYDTGIYPGLTIIDSMSTLWVMNLSEEWEEGKQWISTVMPNLANTDELLLVQEAVLDYLGGLLSAYFLSGEQIFLTKAKEISDGLKTAFYPTTGMLAKKWNPKGKRLNDLNNSAQKVQLWNNATFIIDHQRQSKNWLANIGFRQPELIAIANMTNDKVLLDYLAKNRKLMSNIDKFKGLYLMELNTSTGDWTFNSSVLTDFSIEFFYNMPRTYIQLGSKQNADSNQILEMYSQAVDSLQSMGLLWTTQNGRHLYAKSFQPVTNWFYPESFDSSCLLGAMFAISSKIFQELNFTSRAETHLWFAETITEACHSVASRPEAKGGLLPNQFNDVEILRSFSRIYPHLAEPYFFLHRLTGDPKYREWAWKHALVLHQQARAEESGGFTALLNVSSVPIATKGDVQLAPFLSGTLKYLYLIFSEQSVLSLDKWIFNRRGHPLPICGTSELYTEEMCK